ncbi:dihydropteroatesynthase/2-amino-4-hydroxy-6-hydroxymethyldihydropteridinediphosphokinase/dihydroneopterinaldolase [Schizosaccharomyces japonicus yFS275]|uniref:Folic acid synthesis protein FOL1 n=1 Tax=Schizosaccharomyces japonicus (strain yFS275 / FY16936) TaxID=402676 RepID=B6JWN8_SCHJY|nr:dihydropteroatesynthase/2-amino-4-hydroxy-6-hydroxymethyldihydropteridinediphosphokinase/dihydroneopterinaldolase [Schizosaccharomyces japonicus yFS275]EEB05789.1 dihydropteroatesynthase/2-amino-4-hydroxy-6-hydroxymethyldihydropteridinediphosphokinase/dihydroneopterinaldolase [Schizosaccharomyces japonicus yFS275]
MAKNISQKQTLDDVDDRIIIKNLRVTTTVGLDQWRREQPQPVVMHVSMRNNVRIAGTEDDLNSTIHYGIASKILKAAVEARTFGSLRELADFVGDTCSHKEIDARFVEMELTKPKSVLRSDAGVSYKAIRTSKSTGSLSSEQEHHPDRVVLRELQVPAIIGVHPFERAEKQRVVMHVSFECNSNDQVRHVENIARTISEHVEQTSFLTIEALVLDVARLLCDKVDVDNVRVTAEKPSAITFADASAVSVERSKAYFALEKALSTPQVVDTTDRICYVSFGSNVGDRFGMIQAALKRLRSKMTVLDVSPMFETRPMYVTDQPVFLNGVCKVKTNLPPIELLNICQSIENELGRVKLVDKGPRCIDLDLVMLEDGTLVDNERLHIPHLLMHERAFVLRPLLCIAPDLVHPRTGVPLVHYLKDCDETGVHAYRPYLKGSEQTDACVIMGILNVTPDSFSDGGECTLDSIVEKAKAMVEKGARILDIGGQSTRPGAQLVPAEAEANRVIPAIQALRSAGITTTISVDTYSSQVAKQAISAGADVINDVTAGQASPDMLSLAADLGVPICLMHNRGNVARMHSHETYDGNVVTSVREELAQAVQRAIDAGIPRYNIILDPGFGFSKDAKQNIELLSHLQDLIRTPGFRDLAWLSAPSRKRFVGVYSGETSNDPKRRTWGTAAAITTSVLQGANIVRVHDVDEMAQVVAFANAVQKSNSH